MRILKWVAILASVLALFSVGCAGRKVLNVEGSVVTAKPNPSPDEVAKAIIRAGVNTNWRITEAGPGQLIGFRSLGSNNATISISYSPQKYSISLKESTMSSERTPGPASAPPSGAPELTVHRTYNRWVQELDLQIRAQLSAI